MLSTLLSVAVTAKTILLITGLVLLPSLMIPRGVAARTGDLDTSFNESGVALTPFWTGAIATSLAIQTDGKIVVAGYTLNLSSRFALARYYSNGTLDATFGPSANGTVTTVIGSVAEALGVAVQNDGKVVAVGYSLISGVANFALARYTPSGHLDATFGLSGIQTSPIGRSRGGAAAVAKGVVLQSDGKIVTVGWAEISGVEEFALARYNSFGLLDSSFNSRGLLPGVVTTPSQIRAALMLLLYRLMVR